MSRRPSSTNRPPSSLSRGGLARGAHQRRRRVATRPTPAAPAALDCRFSTVANVVAFFMKGVVIERRLPPAPRCGSRGESRDSPDVPRSSQSSGEAYRAPRVASDKKHVEYHSALTAMTMPGASFLALSREAPPGVQWLGGVRGSTPEVDGQSERLYTEEQLAASKLSPAASRTSA